MFSTIDKAWVASAVGALATISGAVFGVELGANVQTAIVGVIWAVVQGYLVWQTPNKA